MKNKALICAALAGIIGTGLSAQAAGDKEKCYGIAKAGKNDCKSADGAHSCQGQATTDNSPNEWKFVAKGECVKMQGSLEPVKAMKK